MKFIFQKWTLFLTNQVFQWRLEVCLEPSEIPDTDQKEAKIPKVAEPWMLRHINSISIGSVCRWSKKINSSRGAFSTMTRSKWKILVNHMIDVTQPSQLFVSTKYSRMAKKLIFYIIPIISGEHKIRKIIKFLVLQSHTFAGTHFGSILKNTWKVLRR